MSVRSAQLQPETQHAFLNLNTVRVRHSVFKLGAMQFETMSIAHVGIRGTEPHSVLKIDEPKKTVDTSGLYGGVVGEGTARFNYLHKLIQSYSRDTEVAIMPNDINEHDADGDSLLHSAAVALARAYGVDFKTSHGKYRNDELWSFVKNGTIYTSAALGFIENKSDNPFYSVTGMAAAAQLANIPFALYEERCISIAWKVVWKLVGLTEEQIMLRQNKAGIAPIHIILACDFKTTSTITKSASTALDANLRKLRKYLALCRPLAKLQWIIDFAKEGGNTKLVVDQYGPD